MESLFGKEFGGTMPPTLSSPVLPGGVHISGGGTVPRPKSASRLTGLFNPPKPSIKVSHLTAVSYLSLQIPPTPCWKTDSGGGGEGGGGVLKVSLYSSQVAQPARA